MEKNENLKVVKIGFFKKIWLSITKFEKYPEMATEGVGRAISYLVKLMIIFSIVIVIGMMYNFNYILKQGAKYIDENISEINYQDGKLNIKPKDVDKLEMKTEIGTLIIDTNEKKDEEIRKYEEKIQKDNIGIIWLNNKIIVYSNGVEEAYYYGDLMQAFNITKLSKEDIVNYLQNNNKIYIIYFVATLIATVIIYLIATLIDVLILSIFGLLTTCFARIKIRYRAIFNMSVYALTLSIILKMLYITSSMFTDFEIKYFDFMYSAIGYIYLVAAIFMIKSDVIKQQIELMRINNEQKQNEQEQEEKEEEEKEEQKEKEDEDKNENKEDKKKEEPKVNNDTEGSQA